GRVDLVFFYADTVSLDSMSSHIYTPTIFDSATCRQSKFRLAGENRMPTEFRNTPRYAGSRAIIIALFLGLSVTLVWVREARADTASPTSAAAAEQVAPPGPAREEHGLSQKAIDITRVFGLPITNSLVVTWIVALGLILFARVATRRMKQVPSGAQNFLE